MKILSIDIETCGLDPSLHPMIEFGAVWDDGIDRRSFRALVVRRDGNYNMTPYCVALHQGLFAEIEHVDWEGMESGGYEESGSDPSYRIVCLVEELGTWFRGWLDNVGAAGRLNVAGKNFSSFDAAWVGELLLEAGIKLRRRVLDPAMLYIEDEDEKLPDLKTCCQRAGIEYDDAAAHGAVYDAMVVSKLLRV